ncbi:hypothetical protein JW865_04390 [Candidatus Bathyarchaeota archaeon]|nr:hypothetical protein [Candidatus Bathyarchaeota archaeon]
MTITDPDYAETVQDDVTITASVTNQTDVGTKAVDYNLLDDYGSYDTGWVSIIGGPTSYSAVWDSSDFTEEITWIYVKASAGTQYNLYDDDVIYVKVSQNK